MNVISSNLSSEDIKFNSFWLKDKIEFKLVKRYRNSCTGRVVGESKDVTTIYTFYEDHTQKTESISVSSGYGYCSPKKTGDVNNRNYFITRQYYKNDINKSIGQRI